MFLGFLAIDEGHDDGGDDGAGSTGDQGGKDNLGAEIEFFEGCEGGLGFDSDSFEGEEFFGVPEGGGD